MIKIDVSQVQGLADRLGQLSADGVASLSVEALNETADAAYELSRRTILRGINLTNDYVQRRMDVEHATAKNPQAAIVAYGGKGYMTNLSHYGAMQKDVPVTWNNSWILEEIGEFSTWPGWTERKGDEGRGISPNRKARGVSVEVVRGKRIRIHGAITIPGKYDTEGNPLVFQRKGGVLNKVQNLQGPSVYQLFRTTIPLIEEEVGQDLEKAVVDAVERGWLERLQ